MSWEQLPTDYTDAVWSGYKKYTQIDNDDGSISFVDITEYTNKDNSFFGADEANKMNYALNAIMDSLENGTDLYQTFLDWFESQEEYFTDAMTEYMESLTTQGDALLTEIEEDYASQIETFENAQELAFTTWFTLIKDQLSTDAAGGLQTEIDDLSDRLDDVEYMINNNDFFAILTDDEGDSIVDDTDTVILANWKYQIV